MKRILTAVFLLISFSVFSQNTKVNNTGAYNVRDYGAVGDSSLDCSAAFQRTVDAIAATSQKRGKILIPAGIFKFSTTVVIPDGVHISWMGSGTTHDTIISPSTVSQGYGITKIVMSSSTLDCFRDSSVGPTYSNFDIQNTSATNPTAGSGLNILGTNLSVTNMSIKSFYYGIQQSNTLNPTILNVNFRDCIKYGYYSRNDWNVDIGDDAIIGCQFASYFVRTQAQIFKKGSGGLKVSNCKFNAGNQMIGSCIVDSVIAGMSTIDLFLDNNSYENFVDYAVNVAVIGGGIFGHITIMGGDIYSPTANHGSGIKLTNSSSSLFQAVISGVVINSGLDTGIIANTVDYLTISGNSNNAAVKQVLTSCTNVFDDHAPGFTDAITVTKSQNSLLISGVTNGNAGTGTAAGFSFTAGATPVTGYLYKTPANYATSGLPSSMVLQDPSNIVFFNNANITLKAFSNNNINIGPLAVDNTTGLLQVQSTAQSQLALHYDASNKTQFATSATGNLNVTPSGGNVTLTSNLILPVAKSITITEGTDGRLGSTTLVSGTKAITINSLTTSSRAFVQITAQGGTSTGVYMYKAVCTTNTLTITAIDWTGATVTTDTSVLNYFVIN